MLLACLSDLHSNREALEACLAQARADGAERFAFLGDYVGYGADPSWVTQQVMDYAAEGAIVIKGNHDEAAADDGRARSMNPAADAAIAWTQRQLDPPTRNFLRDLPLTIADDDRLFVHADAVAPERWRYVLNAEDAARNFFATETPIILCGHVHMPAIYGQTATMKTVSFRPVTDVPVPIPRHRRWLVVLGSVGQPRDGIPAAAYAILDTRKSEITFRRAPYDIEAAARKIRDNGLPDYLAERLYLAR